MPCGDSQVNYFVTKQNVLGPIRDFKWYSLPKDWFCNKRWYQILQLVFSAVTCSKEKNITVNYQRFWNNLYLICFSSLHAISNKLHIFNDIYTFQIRMCNTRACKWISRWQMTDRDRFLKSHLQATQLSEQQKNAKSGCKDSYNTMNGNFLQQRRRIGRRGVTGAG